MLAKLNFLGVVGLSCFSPSRSLLQTRRPDVTNMALRGTNQLENATLPEKLQTLGSSIRQLAKSSHDPVRFEVVLDRSKGEPNGIATAWLKGGSGGIHCITSIDEQGLVFSWNKAHPSKAMMKDDCILEVNGVRGSADEILKELKQQKVLRIKVQRGGMFMRPESVDDAVATGKHESRVEPKPSAAEKSNDTAAVVVEKRAEKAAPKKAAPKNAKTAEKSQSAEGESLSTTKPAAKLNSSTNNSYAATKANISQVLDAALRAAHKADTVAKETSITWNMYPPKYALANPGCFNHTGRKCEAYYDNCGPGAICQQGWCVCGSSNCADAFGTCRAVPNQWLAMDLRIAPAEDTHQFVAMPTDQGSGPYMVTDWPDSANAEALWDFLVQPDNVSVLIATKWGRDHWHGRFLDLNESSGWFDPVQRQPYDALQASWNLIVLPYSKLAFRHARTGLYLKYENGKLATCASPDCPAQTADFDIWPRIENDQEPCNGCETPYFQPKGSAVKGHTPWFLNPMEGWGTRSAPKSSRAPDRPWYMKEH